MKRPSSKEPAPASWRRHAGYGRTRWSYMRCVCRCERPCWRLLCLSARQAWGGFDVTEGVPVKRRFNTDAVARIQRLSPLILFQSLLQPLISDSAGPLPFLSLQISSLFLSDFLSLLKSLYPLLHLSFFVISLLLTLSSSALESHGNSSDAISYQPNTMPEVKSIKKN